MCLGGTSDRQPAGSTLQIYPTLLLHCHHHTQFTLHHRHLTLCTLLTAPFTMPHWPHTSRVTSSTHNLSHTHTFTLTPHLHNNSLSCNHKSLLVYLDQSPYTPPILSSINPPPIPLAIVPYTIAQYCTVLQPSRGQYGHCLLNVSGHHHC